VPKQEIFCTVSSCFYYAAGDSCAAAKIMVRNNPSAQGLPDMEIGSLGGQAETSNQTLCETFIPKRQGPKPGIERIDRKG
jgi:hypothetical protein